MKTYFVTGGAGFIGSEFVIQVLAKGHKVINYDLLTYSGNLENLSAIAKNPNYTFIQGDIGNFELLSYIFETFRPDYIVNFAAESHVDRSIHDPDAFIKTNVLGTCVLLRASLNYFKHFNNDLRFLHVSTDEVYGSLSLSDPAFTEDTAYAPNSPYSASKASSDHLVRSFAETYHFPILITNCSNNYGPRQFPEKLIPLMILNCLAGKPLPIYSKGENIRDWLHVSDHCQAIDLVLREGKISESYNIGGKSERTNIEIVKLICTRLDELRPRTKGNYADLITYVSDRPGHDFRYAIDCTKIERELKWSAKYKFEQALNETIDWYLENETWVQNVQSGNYQNWIKQNYNQR